MSYYYQKRLSRGELMQAAGAGLGAGVAVGAVVFYVARVFLQRTPLAAAERLDAPRGDRLQPTSPVAR